MGAAVTLYVTLFFFSPFNKKAMLMTGQDTELVNVEFEWFDPNPNVDFHGLKTLLRQLLDADAELFDVSALADLILSQPTLGSTVKVEGMETDPYAFLSVINLQAHKVFLYFFYFCLEWRKVDETRINK